MIVVLVSMLNSYLIIIVTPSGTFWQSNAAGTVRLYNNAIVMKAISVSS